jgi:hypothetical protein
VGCGLAITLVALMSLRSAGMLPTSTWGHDSHVFGTAFATQLGLLFVGVIALQLVPDRWARPLLTLEGAACLLSLGWSIAALFVLLLLVWFVALALPLPRVARPFLAGGLLIGLGLCGARHVVPSAYAFSMMFSLRLIMYAWEQWQNGFPRVRLRQFLFYVLAPPLVVFPPYWTFIPAFAKHGATFAARLTTARVRRAFGHFGLAVLFALLTAVARALPGFGIEARRFLMFRYVVLVMAVAEVAHVTYAFLLLHGMDDRPPIDRPFFSRNYLEYWSRFQIHLKDFQVTLFYTPALFRLRRKNRYLVIILAMAWTLIIWNTLVHLLIRYMYTPPMHLLAIVYDALLVNSLNTVALAGTLCLHEWRRKSRTPPPRGFLWEGACWLCTMIFAARMADL